MNMEPLHPMHQKVAHLAIEGGAHWSGVRKIDGIEIGIECDEDEAQVTLSAGRVERTVNPENVDRVAQELADVLQPGDSGYVRRPR